MTRNLATTFEPLCGNIPACSEVPNRNRYPQSSSRVNHPKRPNGFYRRALLVAAAPLLIAGMAGMASAQIVIRPTVTTYNLTDLSASAPHNYWSWAYAINNSGRVAGEFYNPQHWDHAFETQPNAAIQSTDDLGSLTVNGAADTVSRSIAINTSGDVVGDSTRYWTTGINAQSSAFLSIPGTPLENLNTTSSSGSFVLSNANQTFALGMNDAGWIVGSFTTPSDNVNNVYQTHSFVTFGPGWTQPIDSALGNPAFSATNDVNNKDQMVGFLRQHATDNPTAFFIDFGTQHLTMIGIPTGASQSIANALNDSGQVVGNAMFGQNSHAILFQDLNKNGFADPGELVDLDPTGYYSSALSINNSGIAVGYFQGLPGTYDYSKAALFSNGKITDLNTLVNGGTGGAVLRVASGINDGGQIVGYMVTPSGDIHAFRLDPVRRIL